MNSISSIKRGFNPKSWLIAAAIVVVVLGLAAGGLWYAAVQVNDDYMAKLESVGGGIKQKLQDGVANMQEASKKGDAALTATTLTTLAESLETQLDTVPEEPNFLGVPVLNQAARTNKEEIIGKARALADRLTESAGLLTYEKNVLSQVVNVKSLNGSTVVEQEALAKAWLDLLNQLKTKITPPKPAEALHKQLIENVASIQSTLAALPELNEKKDQSGFAAKQKELEGKIADLRHLAEPLRVAYVEQDKAVAAAQADLIKLLP